MYCTYEEIILCNENLIIIDSPVDFRGLIIYFVAIKCFQH